MTPPDRPDRIDAGVPQREIADLYRKIAPMYDAWAILTETAPRRQYLKAAAIRDGESVLEVAVGTGIAFAEIVRSNPNGLCEGIDLTPEMLARASAKTADLPGRHRLQVADAHNLPFENGSFNAVLNSYMFDLLPEPDFADVLGEMRRVLKPGGRLVLLNLAPARSYLQSAFTRLYRLSPKLLGGCRSVDLMPHVGAAGFTGLKSEQVVQLGFPSEIITARSPS